MQPRHLRRPRRRPTRARRLPPSRIDALNTSQGAERTPMRKGLPYLAYGVAAGVVLVGASHDALRAAGSSTRDKLALFAEVFNKVRDNYAEKPDDDKMVKSAIDGMLASL